MISLAPNWRLRASLEDTACALMPFWNLTTWRWKLSQLYFTSSLCCTHLYIIITSFHSVYFILFYFSSKLWPAGPSSMYSWTHHCLLPSAVSKARMYPHGHDFYSITAGTKKKNRGTLVVASIPLVCSVSKTQTQHGVQNDPGALCLNNANMEGWGCWSTAMKQKVFATKTTGEFFRDGKYWRNMRILSPSSLLVITLWLLDMPALLFQRGGSK